MARRGPRRQNGAMQISDIETIVAKPITDAICVRTLFGSPGKPRLLVVDFEPGAHWPGVDVHEPGRELVWVVRGSLLDDGKLLGEGAWVEYPAGSSHSPSGGPHGCRLLVIYPEG